MGPRHLLQTVTLLLVQVAPQLKASQYCGHLEYWNSDNKCCSSCLQRFGPPPCPDHEFTENCGYNDFGDLLAHPFKKCPPGQCNPDGEERCSPCSSEAKGPTLTRSRSRSQQRCREKPIPPKGPCPLPSEETTVPSSSVSSSLSRTTKRTVTQPSFVLPLVLVLLSLLVVLILAAILLQKRGQCKRRREASLPSPVLVYGDLGTHTHLFHSPSPGTQEATETGTAGKLSLLPFPKELQGLESQPLSLLLDELEVLEELIMLLDPEPGPAGGMAYGTTRHLAARYGLPATWSTFAYSLRPSRSPLRALIEVVVAREPSASLGQLGAYLAQLGRADALYVLSKLG